MAWVLGELIVVGVVTAAGGMLVNRGFQHYVDESVAAFA